MFSGLLSGILIPARLGALRWVFCLVLLGLGAGLGATGPVRPGMPWASLIPAILLLGPAVLAGCSFTSRKTGRLRTRSSLARPSPNEGNRTDRDLLRTVAEPEPGSGQQAGVPNMLVESDNSYRRLLEVTHEGVCGIDSNFTITHVNCRLLEMLHARIEHLVGQNVEDFVYPEDLRAFRIYLNRRRQGVSEQYEFRFRRCDGSPLRAIVCTSALTDREGRYRGTLAMLTDVSERRQMEEQLRGHQSILRGFYDGAPMKMGVVELLDGNDLLILSANRLVAEYFNLPIDQIEGKRVSELGIPPERLRFWIEKYEESRRIGGPVRYEYRAGADDSRWMTATVNFLGLSEEGRARFLFVGEDITHRKQAEADIRDLNDRLRRRLDWETALRRVDSAILEGGDLHEHLNLVLSEAARQLGVGSACLLVAGAEGCAFSIKASIGVESPSLRSGRLQLDSQTLRSVVEHRRASLFELSSLADYPRAQTALSEGFTQVLIVPLLARGSVQGVLEIFGRSSISTDPEWRESLETLSGQAAMAIDNATLIEELQHSHAELTAAYEATIEGWARVLDLRDKETEGHSQRVTEMTVRLARSLGISESELIHVRRGALLHDIGKMGIPDGILLKPGPLNEEEWSVMKRHPTYAYEMLSPIAFLRPALDIPLNHHERWDGNGYPRGLRQEQIPITARIFATVDIWDALSHDRPYRPAWEPKAVREHLQSLAGSHLDPLVVRHFLALLDDRSVREQIERLDDSSDESSAETSWSPAPIPAHEAERLETLRLYELLDTPPEESFDEITRLATSLCETPMGLICLVDADRQWFKSQVGLSIQETCRDLSFCAHAILQDGLFLVPDARTDDRFAHHPLVVAGPRIRFYAGAPLITPSGHVIGTLCVMDHVPRSLSPTQRGILRVLAQSIVGELERRRQLRQRESLDKALKEQEAAYRSLVQAIPQKVFRKDLNGCFTFANNHFCEDLGLRPDEVPGRTDYDFFPLPVAEQYRDDDRMVIQTRQPIDLMETHHPSATRVSYVHTVRVPILDECGTTLGVQGMLFDVTGWFLAEQSLRDAETRFHAFMKHSPCAAFIKNENLRYVYINSRFETMYQTTSAQVMGKSDSEIFPGPNALRHQESDARVLETGESVELVESVERPDGFLREFLTLKFPFLDSSGQRMLGGVTLDVTPQKAIERTLSDQLGLAERLNAEMASRSRSLEQVNALLMEQATTDSLTGLRNRRAFFEALQAALSESNRHDRPLSVLMLDVDDFKSYNDDFGHPAGDVVLCEVANILMSHARAHDLAARYGGEEFVVLLPNASDDEAAAAASRLLEAIAQHPWPLRPITASFGVASLVMGERMDAQLLMEGADRALYHSKRTGRNRVTHIRDLHVPSATRWRTLGV